ncbi:MAG: glycosyltransferase [Candidatus Binatia bacterium]
MISGAIARHPLYGAGNSWAFLQYVLGFRELGFDVYYVEQLNADDWINDEWQRAEFNSSANVRYFCGVMEQFGLTDRSALLESDGSGYVGLSHAEVEDLAPDIDLLINLSGCLHSEPILSAARRRVYIDLDPGYTQIWHEQYGVDMHLRDHDVYVTVGLNLGEPDCPFPTCGIRWQKSLPPVVIDEWVTTQPPRNVYSTVAEWRGFSPIEWRGSWYNQKADEFKRIIDLPRRVAVPVELCLFIHPDEPDRAELERYGWELASPTVHAVTIDAYRNYIMGSRAEFTAVKQGYAAGRTGWFSDRSACYLAAGRPVIVQDTGIGKYLPTGLGLLTFADLEGAAAAIDSIENDYVRHALAAADFARKFLDANVVLPRLLRLAGI